MAAGAGSTDERLTLRNYPPCPMAYIPLLEIVP